MKRGNMYPDFRFNAPEIAGALGDFGTLVPIVIGVAAVTPINLAQILFFFSLAFIATGLVYRLPMPVEPMKAMGVIAIAGGLTAAEIAGAGIMMGLVLLLLALTGTFDRIKAYIPVALTRGIQLGLGLLLLRQALLFVAEDWVLGLLAVAIILVFTMTNVVDISALVVLLLGIGWGIYHHGPPPVAMLSGPWLNLPDLASLGLGFWQGTLPQIPLTLGNAVLATSLLIHDLFQRRVPENRLLISMSVMCLVASPLGGFPMCHGAGGLAAQYRFGARTGGSNLISGLILLPVAVFLASPDVLRIFPYGALGALLLFAGMEVIKSGLKTDALWFSLATGLIALVAGMTPAFLGMLALYWLWWHGKRRRKGVSDGNPS